MDNIKIPNLRTLDLNPHLGMKINICEFFQCNILDCNECVLNSVESFNKFSNNFNQKSSDLKHKNKKV